MSWDLKRVAVIGAGGKMGRGIAFLLLQEMAKTELKELGRTGSGEYRLYLIDANEGSLSGLRKYLQTQLTRAAEKSIIFLREGYAKNPALVSNQEIIKAFVEGAFDNLQTGTSIDEAKKAKLVFEAALEDVEVKRQIFDQLKSICSSDTLFFTNTSSIPVSVLETNSKLNHRLIGFHFYNPPAVQKLVEIIPPEDCPKKFLQGATDLAKRLGKTVVESHDVAGFIGNGHFVREILFACGMVRDLQEKEKFEDYEAIYMINQITQEILLRPMGTFQLLDYVGIDVAQHIGDVMTTYILGSEFHDPLIAEMVKNRVIGGQNSDGTQKNGFFEYNGGSLAKIYSLKKKAYVALDEGVWKKRCDEFIGPFEKKVSFKSLANDPQKDEKLKQYFQFLFTRTSSGALLALEVLKRSRSIAQQLVQDKVADSMEDISTVLQKGFYHLYGPEDPFILQEGFGDETISKKSLHRGRV